MHLTSIIAIYDISPLVILSSILTTAYQKAKEVDSPPNLLLLSENSRDALHQYTWDSVTYPPIDSSFKSPFLGWRIHDIAQFLMENAEGSLVDSTVFLVADKRTEEDRDTFLLVQSLEGERETILEHVRLSAECVNTEAVAVSVATKDVGELASLVDNDGVYRIGDEKQPRRKGGKAPRKQL